MNSEIILAIGVVLVLLTLLVIIFTFTVKRVNGLMKKIFVDRLQEYDYLIDDKEKKIDILDKSIDRKTKSYAKLEQEVEELEKTLESVEEVKREHIILPTDADFEDGNILSGYKKIKDGFSFDVEAKIKEFLETIDRKDDCYDLYCKVRGYFSHKSVYTIMTYQSNDQKTIVSELLDDNEKEILKSLLNKRKFNIVNFLSELDGLILNSNPEIKIYIGNENENFDYLNKNITTIYDESITEGFKIIYKGVIYDYSI